MIKNLLQLNTLDHNCINSYATLVTLISVKIVKKDVHKEKLTNSDTLA